MARRGAFVVIYENKKVLLVKRTDIPFWDLPGGGVNKDELETVAAVRETLEETGYVIEIDYKIGEYERPEYDDTQHLFSAKIVGGEAISTGLETSKLKWFSLNSLPLLMIPHRKKQIGDFFSGSKCVQTTLKEPFIFKMLKKLGAKKH